MSDVSDVLVALEKIAPARFAFAFDKVGLQVGDPNATVQRAVVSLDRSLAAIQFAKENKAAMLISHHPLIFEPLSSITSATHVGRACLALIQGSIAFAAAHTNWDAATGGINDVLSEILRLEGVTTFGYAAEVGQLKMVVSTPPDLAQKVIDAASLAGAGVIGLYRRCAFSSEGEGTFEPLPGANPTIGEVGRRETVSEVRIEMSLPSASQDAVRRAVEKAHPYETPALDFYELTPLKEQPAGRIGTLNAAMPIAQFAQYVEERLSTKCWAWGAGNVERVAVVGGAADGEWRVAQGAGADVLITGEVKQHIALEATEGGFSIIAAGHYATENPGSRRLMERLKQELPEIEWLFFDPAPGQAGRPF